MEKSNEGDKTREEVKDLLWICPGSCDSQGFVRVNLGGGVHDRMVEGRHCFEKSSCKSLNHLGGMKYSKIC